MSKIYPLPDKLDRVSGKYELVIVAAKRARQLAHRAESFVSSESSNPLTVALEEIAQGKVIPIQTAPPETLIEAPRPITVAASVALVPSSAVPTGEATDFASDEHDEILHGDEAEKEEVETLDKEIARHFLGEPEEGTADGELGEDVLTDGVGMADDTDDAILDLNGEAF